METHFSISGTNIDLLKCHSCQGIMVRSALKEGSTGIRIEHFPLKCEACGNQTVLRISWDELSNKELQIIHRLLVKNKRRCLGCGTMFTQSDRNECPECKGHDSYRIIETFPDYDPEIDN